MRKLRHREVGLLIGMTFFLMVLLVASLLMGVQDSLGETMKVS